jgi:Ca2+/H+ antiporter
MAWGLYLINKKSGEQYPWLAFIPLVQIYSFVKAGGKDGIWVLWLILGYMALVIPGLVLTIMVIHGISKRTGNGAGSTILAIFFPYIMYPIMGSNMVDSSVKTESIPL